MKGAIGNAFILNMVITFITIFLLLVVGSMAYTKAYKVKNYLLNEVTKYVEDYHTKYNRYDTVFSSDEQKAAFDNIVNPYLEKAGYSISNGATCSSKLNDYYQLVIKNKTGRYDYCIYSYKYMAASSSDYYKYSITYMVLVYMRFDFPVVGNYIRIPMTSETKTFVLMK